MIEDEVPDFGPFPDDEFFDPTPDSYFHDQVDPQPFDQPLGTAVVDHVAELKKAKVEEAKQANKMRSHFFCFGVSAASVCVATSVIFMALSQICGQRVSDAASVAFISGLSVQAIGITKIMANYLFPSPGKPEEKS